jgi:hypothetical protein
MSSSDPYRHRIRLPAGAEPVVRVGDALHPGDTVATAVRPRSTISIPVARALRRKKQEVPALLVTVPGARVLSDQPVARTPEREVRSPVDGYFLAYDPGRGTASVLTLDETDPVVSDVRGTVIDVDRVAVTVAVPAVSFGAVAGTGPAVHGPLSLAVNQPDAALDPGLIDADAAGRILIGGSWASAEAITRARAVGVAAIVVGGFHAKDLADFASLQHRRSLLGTAAPPFAILALDGFGRAAMDPARFAWLQAQGDRQATILGDQRRLLVYDAAPAPARRPRATVGDRVVIAAGPGRGQTGLLSEILGQPVSIGSGITTLGGLVRLDAGRTVTVAMANLEASAAVP